MVFDNLWVTSAMETSSLTVLVTHILDLACALTREALYIAVHRMFTIVCSHYINIDLPVISECFAPGYTDYEEKVREEILPKGV